MEKLLHTPEGVRDIYNVECGKKLALENRLKKTLHLFGYHDIQTPTFEYFDVFRKEIGTIPSKDLYKFFDKEGNTLVLRPDITPSIARVAATLFGEEDLPIRLCYTGNTFINHSNNQGRLREVTQMGAELIGDDSVYADAEMIAMTIESLYHAGLSDFQISIGNVEYFKGICEEAGLTEETEEQLRELISGKNFFGAEELLDGIHVKDTYKNALLKVSELFGGKEILAKASDLALNSRAKEAVHRLEKVYEVLCQYGVEKYVSFDLGMLSNYNYYTGIIFKGFTYGIGDAIIKGGRYNNLLKQFGKEAPAIGFVIVIDDLLVAMNRQETVISGVEQTCKIYYTEATFEKQLMTAKKMRADGKCVELLPEVQK